MATPQTYGSPIGAFLRGFQGAQARQQQAQQQEINNALTEQLRQVQLLTAQRQLADANKPLEQRIQEAIAPVLALQGAKGGYLTQQAIPGLVTAEPNAIQYTAPQLAALEIASKIAPPTGPEQPLMPAGSQFGDQAPVASDINTALQSAFAIPRAAPAQFQTNIPGTNLALSPTLQRQSEDQALSNEIALANAKFSATPHPVMGTNLQTGETKLHYLTASNPSLPQGVVQSNNVAFTGQTGSPLKTKADIQSEQNTIRNELAGEKSTNSEIDKLSKATQSNAVVKEFQTISRNFETLDSLTGSALSQDNQTNPVRTGADTAAIDAFNLVFNPRGVVRQFSYVNTLQNRPILDQGKSLLQKYLGTGQKLTPEDLQSMRDLARVALDNSKVAVQKEIKPLLRRASDQDITPEQFLPEYLIPSSNAQRGTPAPAGSIKTASDYLNQFK